jgi:hypothetical protein
VYLLATYLHAYLPTCPSTYLPTTYFLEIYLLTYLPTCKAEWWLVAYLPDYPTLSKHLPALSASMYECIYVYMYVRE